MSRFDYVKYDEEAVSRQNELKAAAQKLEDLIGQVGGSVSVPNSGKINRAKALAFTKLEEVYMWAGKAIRDDQVARNGSATLQEERKDG